MFVFDQRYPYAASMQRRARLAAGFYERFSRVCAGRGSFARSRAQLRRNPSFARVKILKLLRKEHLHLASPFKALVRVRIEVHLVLIL